MYLLWPAQKNGYLLDEQSNHRPPQVTTISVNDHHYM
jgi:hypothetical protein